MPEPPRRPDRPIVLVGPPGAGKTTVGKRLARRLDLPFADSDAEIERGAGRNIAEIIGRNGEASFRRLERQAVARLAEDAPGVIALGGGAFADDVTRALLLDTCLVVRLEAPIETLAERISRGPTRPLLPGRDPRAALADLVERREAGYAEAPVAVSAEGEPEAVVERILAALAEQAR